MPLPIMSDTYRVTFTSSPVIGVVSVNVLNVLATAVNEDDVWGAIDSALDDRMFHPWHNSRSLAEISVLALDGISASVVAPPTSTHSGGGSSPETPALAAVVSLRTTQRGPRGRGRVYVGPVCEDMADNGLLTSDCVAQMLAGWGAFFTALGSGTPIVTPGVASYTHETFAGLGTMHIDQVCGTQRRRQSQLR